MRIGELAKAANCTTDTVRFYEKEGLLPPPERTEANYRNYTPAHIDRLRFIRNCRALDMTHDEVRALLSASYEPSIGCGTIDSLLDEHIAHVDERIAELVRLREQLGTLRARCAGDAAVKECGIMQGLTSMETTLEKHRGTHLG
ncbi:MULTISPECIES: Cd(II)/Pb(II)-responsive transcriptional regulator [Caballeronia]|uniref:MerR family transcriptional regulator n=1 Tax=Caballeronia zhejiangensis TaxID=871203 RepID=A0A656QGS1_9BURK|nr:MULTISPECIES: Cd(II)/Pb(II)-responsive transcriptional regulator [Caballeronia]KDR28442.1 MerR family transcriptional regulator [Caballeronia zhejiangensis]MCE4547793.1 Cd(II)/Pb(II)-responsive transcriptional regulator [Caballeronia sp. PC1]MCE4575653.1 Cd(II)/Pb(II)-responsive transcriptional regulator [Caballeronia sp. CLC5]